MTRKLNYLSGSAPAWRAWATLRAKDLDVDVCHIDLANGEHKSPDFLAKNPRHKVPVLEDGNVTIYESPAIMQYLEHAYPEPALMPKDKKEYALAVQRFHEAGVLYNATQPMFAAKMMSLPWKDDKGRWDAAKQQAHQELQYFEDHLADGRKYLVGTSLTLADIYLSTNLFFLKRGGATFANYPKMQAWLDGMQKEQVFTDTWPPHWKESGNKDWLSADL